ncbi:recombinase family protein [Streptomyces carminius]|uniref:recombinase family protein n=1 Tax=Streptomyces carminius TaxID=2665496 RepID=UPI0018EC728E|nr:recombinase family protein [Streptomyces carminius]
MDTAGLARPTRGRQRAHGRPALPGALHRQATDARQRHALAPLLAAGAPVYEDPATSTRQLSLDRAGFTRPLNEAAVGNTIHIADAARLFRSVADSLALRPVLIRRGLHLRVESGLLSGIDLASDDPGTKMMVNVLATVLEFQRDMI